MLHRQTHILSITLICYTCVALTETGTQHHSYLLHMCYTDRHTLSITLVTHVLHRDTLSITLICYTCVKQIDRHTQHHF